MEISGARKIGGIDGADGIGEAAEVDRVIGVLELLGWWGL